MKLDPYEYLGLVVPGSVVAFVLTLVAPDVREVIAKDGIDLGGFGLIVLISLVAGYLLQSIGNAIEKVEVWTGIDPSEMLRFRGKGVVSASHLDQVGNLCRERGHDGLAAMSVDDWRAVRGEMAAAIRSKDPANRLDVMLRMYGLGRGLVAAFVLSMILVILFPDGDQVRWKYLVVLGIGLVLSYIRARRFSLNYLRELIVGYSLIENQTTATAVSKGNEVDPSGESE